jgi:hypothetical protein
LAEKLYRLTGLTKDELLAPNIGVVMKRMSERFAGRLGLDSAAPRRDHESFVRSIFQEKQKAPA